MNLLQAFDGSNWQPFSAAIRVSYVAGTHTVPITRAFASAEADCLASTFGYAVIRGSMERPDLIQTARAQLSALAIRNTPRSIYPWVYGTDEPATAVNRCLDTYDSLVDVKIAWDDLEDLESFAGVTQSQGATIMRARFQAMRDHGYRPGLYTTPAVWQQITGGIQLDDDVLVWVANWNSAADLNVAWPFGGQLVGHQYAPGSWGSTCGLAVDLDVFDGDVLMANDPCAGMRQAMASILGRAATIQENLTQLVANASGWQTGGSSMAGESHPLAPPPVVVALGIGTAVNWGDRLNALLNELFTLQGLVTVGVIAGILAKALTGSGLDPHWTAGIITALTLVSTVAASIAAAFGGGAVRVANLARLGRLQG